MDLKKTFRPGNIGALMDEYERAALELQRLIELIPEEAFVRIMDSETNDEDCRSIQTVMSHVISAGFGYANYLRVLFEMSLVRPGKRLFTRPEAVKQLHKMMSYTVNTLEEKWSMSEEEIATSVMQSRWGAKYNVEQLLEHAIVHILRHRRQIEKFIAPAAPPHAEF